MVPVSFRHDPLARSVAPITPSAPTVRARRAQDATATPPTDAAQPSAGEPQFAVSATQEWAFAVRLRLELSAGIGPAPAETTPVAVDPTETEPETPATTERVATRHGRAHVAQFMHRVERALRHELRAALGDAKNEEPGVAQALRAIERDFRHELNAAFRSAGGGQDFDPAAAVSGLSDALRQLADRLGTLLDESTPVANEPTVLPDPTVADDEPVAIAVA